MSTRKFGSLTSSQNPEELANRVKGIVLALSSIIIFGASQLFGISLDANDIVDIATKLGMVSGAIWSAYGGIIALVSYFSKTA